MKTLLIAYSSVIITEELARAFQDKYRVYTCNQGDEALQLLQDLKPDILVIGLSLSKIDGLSVLRHTSFTPPIIVALSPFLYDYILRAAQLFGVGAIISIPFTIAGVESHINRLLSSQ